MKNILVVYDQPDIFCLIHKLLNIKGFSVDFAFDWQEGFKKYVNNHFDMIITAVKMPKCNVNEVLTQIRRTSGHHMFLIGISRTTRQLTAKYFDVIFHKPFRLKTFSDKVQRLFQDDEKNKPAVNQTKSPFLQKTICETNHGY